MREEKKIFLIEMYKHSWENVTRSERNLWQMISVYIAIITGVFVVLANVYLGMWIATMILLTFSFWTFCMILSSHLWVCRNMGLISNIEKEFLQKSDYGSLIPESFARKVPMFKHPLAYFIISELFISLISISSVVYYFIRLERPLICQDCLVIGWLLIGIIGEVVLLIYYNTKHNTFMKYAKGKDLR